MVEQDDNDALKCISKSEHLEVVEYLRRLP